MRKLKRINVVKLLVVFILLVILFDNSYGQLNIPQFPESDSISKYEAKNRLYYMKYYKNNDEVLSINYASGNTVNCPFHGSREADSCYTFRYKNGLEFYLFNGDNIINEQCSFSSNIYRYTKYLNKTGEIIEEGKYFMIKDKIHNVAQRKRYKIGKWNTYKNGELIESIDYDNFKINESIVFINDSNKLILNRLKAVSDSLIVHTFGSTFTEKYIRFNLDLSKYGTSMSAYMRSNLGYGAGFFNETDKPILYADMSYEIVLNDTLRFNPIIIRVSKYLTFNELLNVLNKGKKLSIGLDSSLTTLHKKAINFKKIAKKYDFNLWSEDFYLTMEWKRDENSYLGKLYFLMQELTHHVEKNGAYINYYKDLKIYPVTGEQELLDSGTRDPDLEKRYFNN